MLTQCLGDGQTHLLHLLFQSLLQHRDTGTTLGTRGGAGLQRCNIVVAVNDSLADSAEADVVAGTQDCVVGQFGVGDAVAAASCGQVDVRLSGQFATEQGLQGVEGSGVTDEHATEQGLCVAAGHDLLVHAACGVCEQNLEATLGGTSAITEAGNLNAGELQLGCDVELFNLSFFVVVEQVSCHSVSHSVSRCDQAPGAAQHAGNLTDSPNVLVGGVACVVDENTAALTQCQVSVACQLVVGANTSTEDHHVGGQGADFCILRRRICDGDGDDVAVSVLVDTGDVHAGLNVNAGCLNLGVHGVTAALVNLNGEQPGCHVQDGGLCAQVLQTLSCFEAEQTATDDDTAGCAAEGGLQALDLGDHVLHVVNGAEDVCGVRVKNGDTNRAGTGCEDQHVIGVLVALGVGNNAAGAVKLLCVAVVDQVDVLCIPQFGITEGQVLLGVLENLLDSNAVVGDVGLVVEDGDGVRCATGSFSAFVVRAYKTPRSGACADNENVAGSVRHGFSFLVVMQVVHGTYLPSVCDWIVPSIGTPSFRTVGLVPDAYRVVEAPASLECI